MKCPNCGAEMQDGLLYCESCGEDIHIVPDFEPELELNLEQSMKGIMQDVVPPQEKAQERNKAAAETGLPQSRGEKVKAVSAWVALIIFVIAVVWGGIGLFHHFSLDYQIRSARAATEKGHYDKAIHCYERAMELDQFDVDLKFEIAQVYFLKNDKGNYEYWLRRIVEDPATGQEQLESAYGKLIAIYRARGDYQAINDMLLACTTESIRAAYKSYIAEMPSFSVAAGEYDEVKALKLTVAGKGNIYYTLDGTVPDDTKTLYASPILLENGVYDVKAIYINENGIKSRVAEAEYHISVTELELSPESGDYNVPMLITVTNDPANIYYTVDGTIPTMDSALYTEPIPMPLGESHFCFRRMEWGRSSSPVDMTFTLTLNTDFTPEASTTARRRFRTM